MAKIENDSPRIWRTVRCGCESNVIEMAFADYVPNKYIEMVKNLTEVWNSKLAKNQLRNRYYEGKNKLKNIGIAIPPDLEGMDAVVGWPQAAVDHLANRSRFDGYTASNEEIDAILSEVVTKSSLKRKYSQAVHSELIHSCEFITLSKGGEGEPDVVIQLHSAERASAVWDSRRGRIAYGMAIVDFNDDGKPTEFNLYTDKAVVTFWINESEVWECEHTEHNAGVPLIEALVYRPTENRPFGTSRITRSVRALTDSAVREFVRGELSQEFNTSPQKYLLGADKKVLDGKTKWEAYIGQIFGVSRDENGDIPQFGQLAQGTIDNHTNYMRSLAARFSGETHIPVSVLGVLHDQASSAEAIYAANEGLIIEAEDLNDTNGTALYNIGLMVIAAKQNKPVAELTDEERDFSVNFKNPAMPSIVSQADAMIKIVSAVPEFAETDVFFEQLGFSEDVRRRIASEMKKAKTTSLIKASLLGTTE